MQCGLADYLHLYSKHRAALLKERGGLVPDHPEPVATTWSLSFTAIEQTTPGAADLLRMCVFLQPDAIPEEIILEGAQFLGSQLQALATDPLAFNRAINALLSYSLIRRNPTEHLLSVHRLVQAVLYDAMGEQDREQWIAHVVQALNAGFPETRESVTYEMWGQCERLTPHALNCAGRAVSQAKDNVALATLLTKTADYLRERAQYAEAEPLYQQALHIWKRALGPDHPLVAHSFNGLANVYRDQGKYEQAEPLYQRALHIWKHALGPDHPGVAYLLNNLAELYRKQGKYEQAEPLYQRALAIREQQLGPEHPDVAYPFTGLADLYREQGKYAEAEPLYRRALFIREHALEPHHPDLADTLHGFAALRESQSNSLEAAPLYQRALAIREQVYGLQHPKTIETRKRFIALLHAMRQHEEATRLEAAKPASEKEERKTRRDHSALA